MYSNGKTLDHGYGLVATPKTWKVVDGAEVIVMGHRDVSLIKMAVRFIRGKPSRQRAKSCHKCEWHQRLAHTIAKYVREILKRHGIPFNANNVFGWHTVFSATEERKFYIQLALLFSVKHGVMDTQNVTSAIMPFKFKSSCLITSIAKSVLYKIA